MLFTLGQNLQASGKDKMSEEMLEHLLEASNFRNLLESHHKITGMAYGVFDCYENNLIAVGWQDICVRFHRVHPVCRARCRESDAYIKEHLRDFKGNFLEYRCKNGLVKVAVPIVIAGEHVATLFTGQFFFDDDIPDKEYFRAQGEEFGFDPEEYLEALGRVPVFSREQAGANMEFLGGLVRILVEVGLNIQRLSGKIEERKRTENALKESEGRLSTIVRSIIDPMSLIDRERNIVWANDRAREIFGDDIVGKKCHEAYRWKNEPCNHDSCAVQIALTDGGGFEASTELTGKNGETLYFSRHANVAKWDENGKPALILEISRDITERKRQEDLLRESEARLRRAEEIAHLGYLEHDLVTDMVSFSDETWRIFGEIPRESAITCRSFLKRIHPDDREMVIKALSESVEGRSPLKITHRIIRPEFEIRYVHAQARTEYDDDGRPLRSVGTVQDITERKRLEEQLNHSLRMEAVGQLAGGIAHDFNNILTAIIGFSYVLQKKLGRESPLNAYVENIAYAAERASTLTSDLLAFSRKNDVRLYPIDLNSAVRRANNFLSRLRREDIELRVFCCESSPIISGNENQVVQILMNLATNARDALPDGGVISISTSSIVIGRDFIHCHGFGREGRFALLTFADTGTGMDDETRQRIFEPFFTTKEVGKGTGLGLSTLYGIVMQLKGFISVYSESGKGTVFRIYLPQVDALADGEETRGKETFPLPGSGTILLAEDDSDVREISELMLREAGFTVVTAKNGREAASIFLEFKDVIDLLILDTLMPGKNGLEVFRLAEKSKPDIKVIFMSGYTEDLLGIQEIEEKRAEFLQKPVNPNEFIRIVREVMRRRII